MLDCLNVVLRGQLPLATREIDMRGHFDMGIERLQVALPHHLIAETGVWNQDIRLEPLPYLKSVEKCSIWEVGAHTEAADSSQFMASYPHCHFHAYEPVPMFAEILKRKWASDNRLLIHEYGIGGKSLQLHMNKNSLRGQGTFISSETSDNHGDESSVNISIKSFSDAEAEADGLPTLLHLNCEGCEWELLKQAATSWSLARIPIIQIGWHNYGGDLGLRVWQTCEIREELSKTHQLVVGAAFGWDRWLRKDVHG